jgi:hypothetical protein
MQSNVQSSDELQAIKSKFLTEIEDSKKEIHPKHAPTFIQIIERRMGLLKEFLGIIEANPSITLDELAALVDHRLETAETAIQNAKNIFETDKVFVDIRILDWIRYLVIEKNGRIPDTID